MFDFYLLLSMNFACMLGHCGPKKGIILLLLQYGMVQVGSLQNGL